MRGPGREISSKSAGTPQGTNSTPTTSLAGASQWLKLDDCFVTSVCHQVLLMESSVIENPQAQVC